VTHGFFSFPCCLLRTKRPPAKLREQDLQPPFQIHKQDDRSTVDVFKGSTAAVLKGDNKDRKDTRRESKDEPVLRNDICVDGTLTQVQEETEPSKKRKLVLWSCVRQR
jgi:hypothetical protein